MKRKILILSDSLALARVTPESLLLEESWAYRLRELADAEWVQCSIGGATSSDLLAQAEYWLHSARSADWLIIQAGIVDWAPRAFSRNEVIPQKALALFTRLFPWLGREIFERLRRWRRISYVEPQRFRQNVQAFRRQTQNQGTRLLWIPVMGSSSYEKILPGITEKIAQANGILREELGSALMQIKFADELFMSDGHHFRATGHEHLAQQIFKHISEGR
ncbi:SGNH/GDSL hydrolase family protein [Pseudomonas sp. SL4(2022)]|uniref:SGNH/GDSL hydrolase family protein n=1 Tax=Pseudomonas sp. SL4(2022) TaxID=2994661 RepID=UPI002270C976|nr:SGNH/GDSL hydrolase family protein [Pseudomonas sp. SL4(2022)]WAC44797.1 SGNH/GDSL hydrolase family protein [Pseudomonas sp. SL4(2022)]